MGDRTLAHIGYVVRDMDRALERFEKEGAVILLPPTVDPLQKVEVALMELDGAARVELIAPLDDGDSPVKGRLSRGGGLDHICYYVDDVHEALEQERLKGAMVVCEPCHARAFNRTIAFVHRKGGLVVELMSRDEVQSESG
jgi:methylmalonyl-CoA/ethylmalonyl-CoA epimerase